MAYGTPENHNQATSWQQTTANLVSFFTQWPHSTVHRAALYIHQHQFNKQDPQYMQAIEICRNGLVQGAQYPNASQILAALNHYVPPQTPQISGRQQQVAWKTEQIIAPIQRSHSPAITSVDLPAVRNHPLAQSVNINQSILPNQKKHAKQKQHSEIKIVRNPEAPQIYQLILDNAEYAAKNQQVRDNLQQQIFSYLSQDANRPHIQGLVQFLITKPLFTSADKIMGEVILRMLQQAQLNNSWAELIQNLSDRVRLGVVGTKVKGYLAEEGYDLTSKLGEGAMGQVFLARNRKLKQNVAIKIVTDPEQRDSRDLNKEAIIGAHGGEHFVKIYATGTAESYPYIVMDLIEGAAKKEGAFEGDSLLNLIKERSNFPTDARIVIIRDLFLAIHTLHKKEISHNDLKHANYVLTPTAARAIRAWTHEQDERKLIKKLMGKPSVKLVDPGLAGFIRYGSDQETDPPPNIYNLPDEIQDEIEKGNIKAEDFTPDDGIVMGTPVYMSPEQCSGILREGRSDVYSAGVNAFELLTGRHPIVFPPGTNFMGVASTICTLPRETAIDPDDEDFQKLHHLIQQVLLKTTQLNNWKERGSMEESLQVLNKYVTGFREDVREAKEKAKQEAGKAANSDVVVARKAAKFINAEKRKVERELREVRSKSFTKISAIIGSFALIAVLGIGGTFLKKKLDNDKHRNQTRSLIADFNTSTGFNLTAEKEKHQEARDLFIKHFGELEDAPEELQNIAKKITDHGKRIEEQEQKVEEEKKEEQLLQSFEEKLQSATKLINAQEKAIESNLKEVIRQVEGPDPVRKETIFTVAYNRYPGNPLADLNQLITANGTHLSTFSDAIEILNDMKSIATELNGNNESLQERVQQLEEQLNEVQCKGLWCLANAAYRTGNRQQAISFLTFLKNHDNDPSRQQQIDQYLKDLNELPSSSSVQAETQKLLGQHIEIPSELITRRRAALTNIQKLSFKNSAHRDQILKNLERSVYRTAKYLQICNQQITARYFQNPNDIKVFKQELGNLAACFNELIRIVQKPAAKLFQKYPQQTAAVTLGILKIAEQSPEISPEGDWTDLNHHPLWRAIKILNDYLDTVTPIDPIKKRRIYKETIGFGELAEQQQALEIGISLTKNFSEMKDGFSKYQMGILHLVFQYELLRAKKFSGKIEEVKKVAAQVSGRVFLNMICDLIEITPDNQRESFINQYLKVSTEYVYNRNREEAEQSEEMKFLKKQLQKLRQNKK